LDSIKAISETDCIVEVNTRGFYKKNGFGLYPSDWIIKEMNKLGIRIVVSSDAHHPSEVDAGFDYAEFILAGCGYKEYWMLGEDKQWLSYPIDH
jgi:histidinol-phosphatase (PHP family)